MVYKEVILGQTHPMARAVRPKSLIGNGNCDAVSSAK